jgi:hypothetical protein
MNEKPGAKSEEGVKVLLPIVSILAILLFVTGSYLGAYWGAGVRVDWRAPSGEIGTIERTYTRKWAITLFAPAAWAETKLRDVQVQAVYVSPEYQQRLQKLRVTLPPASQAPALKSSN